MPKPQSRAWARIRLTRARGLALLAGVCALALVALAFALTGPGHSSAAAAPPASKTDADAGHGASSGPSTSPSASTSPSPTHSATAGASSSPSASATEDPDQKLSAAVSSLVSADDGHVSVAVENLSTGTTVSDNVSDDYVTASIVKLDILETMLYQDQQSGSSPSSSESEDITEMIDRKSVV